MTHKTWISITLTCFCLGLPVIHAAILHVPADYPVIQAAIDAATDGDTVVIAEGTYQGEGNSDLDIMQKAIILQSVSGPFNCEINCAGTDPGITARLAAGTLTIQGLTISNAVNLNGSGGGFSGSGNGRIFLETCLFSDCKARQGGALASSANIELNTCYFLNNDASDSGGGIFLESELPGQNPEALVDNCVISGNAASEKGGGIFCASDVSCQLTACTLTSNFSAMAGGGIYSETSSVTIGGSQSDGNTFQDNRSGSGSDVGSVIGMADRIPCQHNTFSGLQSDYYFSPIDAFELSDNVFQTLGITQDIYVSPDGSDSNTGESWEQAFQTIQHALSVIQASTEQPLTIYLDAGYYNPDLNGDVFPLPLLSHVTIESNTLLAAHIEPNGSGRAFNGRCVENATISSVIIKGGQAEQGGGVYIGRKSSVTVQNAEFRRCKAVGAAGQGSCIYCGFYSSGDISSCSLQGSQSDLNGGAIYLSFSANFTISECLFSKNSAQNNGGAISAGNTVSVVSDCDFEDNSSGYSGGAIHIEEYGSLTVEHSNFISNRSQISGGAICLDSHCRPYLSLTPETANTFNGNYAACGSDLGSAGSNSTPYNAGYSQFDGYHLSDYIVSPQSHFDLALCTSQKQPITVDVYVSQYGNNGLPGITPNAPFKTIGYAISRIQGSETEPAVIHIAPGIYSPGTNGERFPLPLVSNVILTGIEGETVVLDARDTGPVFYGFGDSLIQLKYLTLQGGSDDIGGGMVIRAGSSVQLETCKVKNNESLFFGGGIYAGELSYFVGLDCEFTGNTSFEGGGIYLTDRSECWLVDCDMTDNEALYAGGAVSCTASAGYFSAGNTDFENNHAEEAGGLTLSCNSELNNCRISNNSAIQSGGGLELRLADHILTNCLVNGNLAANGGGIQMEQPGGICRFFNVTLADNTASTGQGGAILADSLDGEFLNCIIWDNDPDGVDSTSSLMSFSFCDIQEHAVGPGNQTANPRFVNGYWGDYYLSQTASGQLQDSPCLNAGSTPSSLVCMAINDQNLCLDELTSRTDSKPDINIVDLGFHYSQSPATPTPQPTPNPTETPKPMGVYLDLSQNLFHPGDLFQFIAEIFNADPEPHTYKPLVVLLEVENQFFWYPDWTEQFETTQIEPGYTTLFILDFSWPETGSSYDGVTFYGALLNPEFTEIVGRWDMVTFGWEE